MTIRVSTIIVSYNRLDLLHRAIQSALAQTLDNCEVIVADNCSSFDVHKELAGYGGAVRAIRTERNGGCGYARNVAVREARGEFVAFLDDDDYWKPEKLERQYETIGDRPMTTCGQEFIPETAFNVQPITAITRRMISQYNAVCGPSGFFCRRDLFDTVQFDESLKYAEDWDFMLRVLDVGEIGYVAEPLLYYTHNAASSMTTSSRGRTWEEIQYRFAAADKHRAAMGEWNYRQRIAAITLAHILDRPDRMTFIRHSLRKAGLAATGVALAKKAASKLMPRPAQSPRDGVAAG
jgi:GalNAc5-diNAcBac-PP-undecaprenol beta-1,3-glucosyltransferase